MALFSLPRLFHDHDQPLRRHDDSGVPDLDSIPEGYRWIKDDCSYGWSVVSRRRATFIALAVFLEMCPTQETYALPAITYHDGSYMGRSYHGSKDLIQLLIDRGAAVGAGQEQYNEALQAAAYGGHGEMIQPLLDKGAEVKAQGGKYGNSLQAANYGGHQYIVRQLESNMQAQGFPGIDFNRVHLEPAGHHSEHHMQQPTIPVIQPPDYGHTPNPRSFPTNGKPPIGYVGYTFTKHPVEHVGQKETWAIVDKVLIPATQFDLKTQVEKHRRKGVTGLDQYMDPDMNGFKRKQIDELIRECVAKDPDHRFEYTIASIKRDTRQRQAGIETSTMQVILQRQPRPGIVMQGPFIGFGNLRLPMSGFVDLSEDYDNLIAKAMYNEPRDNPGAHPFERHLAEPWVHVQHDARPPAQQQKLDHGADPRAPGGRYGYALHAAASKGHTEMVQQLLDRGVEIETRGDNGDTPLYAAAYQGHDQTVQLLLDRGADIEALGGGHWTAFEAAASKRHWRIMQRLLDNGADGNFQGVEYASITVTASNTTHSLLLPLSDSIGQLKQRIFQEIPLVTETLAADSTRSVQLKYDGKVLDNDSRSCMQEGLRHNSHVFCLFENGSFNSC